jgi:predicted phage baseplate assembly protein
MQTEAPINPFEGPRLDDRTYDNIMEEALKLIPLYCPEWTDLNPTDPGIALVELFAWMTDIVLYRLNRVPDKHYIRFMELIGMKLREQEPASVPVTFWLTAPQPASFIIPEQTKVATIRTEQMPATPFQTEAEFEIKVPRLLYCLTSRGTGDTRRKFNNFDVGELAAGRSEVAIFSYDGRAQNEKPQAEDAFYLGFAQDLSQHILGIDLDVIPAKFEGVNPHHPPYKWQVIGDESGTWTDVATEGKDATEGFNRAGLIRLHLPTMASAERDRKTAYWLRCILSKDADLSPIRESPVIRKLTTASWGATIKAINVSVVENEVLGRSDGTPGQRFYLRNTPLIKRIPSEHLWVIPPEGTFETAEEWSEVEHFANGDEMMRHYTLDSVTGELRLAPALRQEDGSARCYGAIPPKGALLVMSSYRFGGGRSGNVGRGLVSVNKSGLPYIERVENRRAATSGKDPESLEQAKMRVPAYLSSVQRAVTLGDYEYLAEEAGTRQDTSASDVGRAYAVARRLPDIDIEPGMVELFIIPVVEKPEDPIAPDRLELKEDLKGKVSAFLDTRRLLCSQLRVSQPDYVWVQTEIILTPTPTAKRDRVRRSTEQRLFKFINPLIGGADNKGWQFGRGITRQEIQAKLYGLPGIEAIESVKLYQISSEQVRAGTFTSVAPNEVAEITLRYNQVLVSLQHNVILRTTDRK